MADLTGRDQIMCVVPPSTTSEEVFFATGRECGVKKSGISMCVRHHRVSVAVICKTILLKR
jgi:hypothetical protein